jgi:hypothetical protein
MNEQEIKQLVAHQSRIRHQDGIEGVYAGCWATKTGLKVIVEHAGGRWQWLSEECEEVR